MCHIFSNPPTLHGLHCIHGTYVAQLADIAFLQNCTITVELKCSHHFHSATSFQIPRTLMTEVNAVIKEQFICVMCQLISFKIIELFLAGV